MTKYVARGKERVSFRAGTPADDGHGGRTAGESRDPHRSSPRRSPFVLLLRLPSLLVVGGGERQLGTILTSYLWVT